MKIGLFFGSFNPIHNGHLLLANYIKMNSNLNQIWFVVTPHNPLKEKKSLLANYHRLEMVNLALGDNSEYRSSNIEFALPQPNYTINTLNHLSEKYPQHQFSIIIGADNLQTFHKWFKYESILNHYRLLVYPRQGFDGGKFKSHHSVQWVAAPQIDISSTFIRDSIKNKKETPYFMPAAAYQYMREMHFYEK